MDPHTAVAWSVAEAYRAHTGDRRPMVVVSTASPYKFSRSVLTALQGAEAVQALDEFACADALERACGLPHARVAARPAQQGAAPQRRGRAAAMADEVRRWVD